MFRKLLFTCTKSAKNLIKRFIAFPPVSHLLDVIAGWKLSESDRRFIRHNKKVWKDHRPENPDGLIIADIFEVEELLLVYSYFANILAKKHNAKISKFIYGYNRFSRKFGHIYKSFNTEKLIRIIVSRTQKKEIESIYQNAIQNIKNKEDLFNFTVEYCHIGIDIYESYLREHNEYTVKLEDPRLKFLIKAAIECFVFWRDFFDQNNVKACLATHDCYIWTNIICKVSYHNKVPVYLPNPRGATYATRPFSIQACYKNYPKIFRLLSEKEQENAINYAKQRLQKRLSGGVGVDMFYSTASSFGGKAEKRIVRQSNKVKILVATHCFYDNPHAFEILPFRDFYEWMTFLGEVSKETDYEWYIKIHPDPRPGTEEIIHDFIKKYPKFSYVHYTIKHNQLIEEGIDVALTCYGSIGEEYPYYDKLVINTGYNPRIAYDFNIHSNSIEEYRENLMKIPELIKKNHIDKNKLHEFYYVHNIMNWVDDMIFESYYKFFNDTTDEFRQSSQVYDYFLNEFSEESHQKHIKKYIEFIESGKKNLFSIGPVE